ncbi:cryptochrome/photolyase family protein [Marinomonas algicola]|jgi:deoxyribodipyrimidine photolyase-related protein|uniref:cryptochrome/photolyase family protein n=1 Tax=Marinomonas algicola TaxID=2773454 RepID=UPI00174DF820|nr:cryptochrome/photolyase family protein [Marinomonas algicola]
MLNKTYRTLRLILGDQLNASHSWFNNSHPQTNGEKKPNEVLYLIAELHQEALYVKHHIHKLCAFFSAMENFAHALIKSGHHVCYLTLDDTQNDKDLPSLIHRLCKQFSIEEFEYQRPDEYRLSQQLETFSSKSEWVCNQVESEHFLLPFADIQQHFKPNKTVRMEAFYRKMRKKYCILMQDNGEPVQGQWNFDQQNRNKLKPQNLEDIPEPLTFQNSVEHILERIHRHQIPYLGQPEKNLIWPNSRQQSKALLTFFCSNLLVNFGRFQDAMTDQSAYAWSLYHSRLSFALNSKMLSPMQVIKAALQTYQDNQEISMAQIEGFIRQILGWREYVRGMYWVNMPDYTQQNQLQAKQALPSFFWDGNTKMHCVSQSIKQSLDYAYAHHIQRLMVTGNFCLLAGIDPKEVDQWYLGIYIDAIEWVELPNTRSMSQFADNWVASKPYAASGNYIQKMSSYCSNCHYKVKQKTGDLACPFNSLYWHFINKHREKLASNPRMSMIYRNWDKQSEEDRSAILNKANDVFNSLNTL